MLPYSSTVKYRVSIGSNKNGIAAFRIFDPKYMAEFPMNLFDELPIVFVKTLSLTP